jgi:Tachylectin
MKLATIRAVIWSIIITSTLLFSVRAVIADTWRGTAPVCRGKCNPGEQQIAISNTGDGGYCFSGHKVLCHNSSEMCQGKETRLSCYGVVTICDNGYYESLNGNWHSCNSYACGPCVFSVSFGLSVAASDGTIYAISKNGDLLWYRHDGQADGSFKWADNNARKVGVGWGDLKQVFSGGNGIIYAIAKNGDLLWYRHDGQADGSFKWADDNARKVGVGWGDLKQVFSGGNGIIYAIAKNGDLLWYRHDGQADGSFKWADNNARKVGVGWGDLKQVFSGGNGIIYAIAKNGDLLWFHHDGQADGSFKWADDNGRKVGVGWGDFQQIFPK